MFWIEFPDVDLRLNKTRIDHGDWKAWGVKVQCSLHKKKFLNIQWFDFTFQRAAKMKIVVFLR